MGQMGGEAQGLRSLVEVETPMLQFILATLFLLLFCVILGFFGLTLEREHVRFKKRRISDCGHFSDYLRYRFAYWFTWTKGSSGIVLCCISITLLVVGALALTLSGTPIASALWTSWVWISNPDGGNSADGMLGCFIGLCVSFGGMLIFALLVSIVSDSIHDVLLAIKSGRYPVVDGQHCVILGSTPEMFVLADELCAAAECRGGLLIAVLSLTPKAELEERVRERCNLGRKSQLVVRCGNPRKKECLQQVAIETAQTVIVLSDQTMTREEADAHTLHTLLILSQMKWPHNGYVLVQCALFRNQRLFGQLVSGSGPGQVLTLADSVGRFMVQCSKQTGLVSCMNNMFGFSGDEFYIRKVKGISGWKFSELLLAFPLAVVAGVLRANGDGEKQCMMVPDMDLVLQEDDQLVVMAEDVQRCPAEVMDTRKQASERVGKVEKGPVLAKDTVSKEIVVVLGWSELLGGFLDDLDRQVDCGSSAMIYSPVPIDEREEFVRAAQIRRNYWYKNLTVNHAQGPLGARFRLEDLPLQQASRVFIFADFSASSEEAADMQTVACVVQVQDILCGSPRQNLNPIVIVPQILHRSSEEMCRHAGVLDVVDSNSMAARIMAATAETPEVSAVFAQLLSPTGVHVRLRRLSDYTAALAHRTAASRIATNALTFQDIVRVAAACGEVALGWSAEGGSPVGPWELNPKNKLQPRSWDDEARIVALSQKMDSSERAAKLGSGDVSFSPFRLVRRQEDVRQVLAPATSERREAVAEPLLSCCSTRKAKLQTLD